MKNVSCSCDISDGILHIRIDAQLEDNAFLRVVDECYGKFTFRHAIWDFSNSNLSGVSAQLFRRLGEAGKVHASKRGKDPRTAVVVTSDDETALIRALSERVSTISPVRVASFRNEQAARDWIANSDGLAAGSQNTSA
jgi:hypothetical protein